jgi:hypothetical protein
MDSMDTTQFEPVDPANTPGPATETRSRRTRRVVTSVAASALLLGGGAGIGIALTGGASASTGGTSAGTGSTSAGTGSTSAANAGTSNTSSATGSAAAVAATSAAGRCARIEQRLRANGHPEAATLVQAYCRSPLLRLALVGGEHGEVTFNTKAGPKTIAFERGTIQTVSSSDITVVAKDGTTWTWAVTSSTKVRDSGQTVTTANLSTGELVLVGGPVVSGAYDAQLIRVRKAS